MLVVHGRYFIGQALVRTFNLLSVDIADLKLRSMTESALSSSSEIA